MRILRLRNPRERLFVSYGHFILNYESGNERYESEHPKYGNARVRFRVRPLGNIFRDGSKRFRVGRPGVFFHYGISIRYLGDTPRSFVVRFRYYRLSARVGYRDNFSKQVFSRRNRRSFFTSERYRQRFQNGIR